MHPENSKRIFMLVSLLLLAVNWKADARESWHFLPTFGHDVRGVEQRPTDGPLFHASIPKSAQKLLSPEGKLTEKQRAEFHWHPATFPHQDFVRLMPERHVFGWYGCQFDVPTELSGMDVLADLGIIDDSDETFVNGTKVGGMGRVPDGSAWQADRLYRISAEWLKRERNYLAVHVWSLWGLGGIVGPPVLKAALAPAGAEWHLAFVKDTAAPASDLNQATTAKDALASFANGGQPLDWRNVSMPWKGFAAWRDDEHYAAFKLNFELKNADGSPKSFSKTMVMDAGSVFDVAAFYLNGRRIGLVGRFPHGEESAFTEAAQRARFAVPPDAWSADGRNELVAVIYRERGVGGLPGVPGLLLHSPMDHQPQAIGDVFDAFLIQLQSGNLAEAEKTLADAKPTTDTERVWRLSHRAHLAFLKWHDGGRRDARLLDGVLAPVAEILSKYPAESPKQSAMQAFCRILRLAEKDGKLLALVRRNYQS